MGFGVNINHIFFSGKEVLMESYIFEYHIL